MRTLLSSVVYIAFIILILLPVDTFGESIIKTIIIVGFSILTLFILCINFVIPRYIYKLYGYEITDTYVLFQKGVLFRRQDFIPIKRIQHIEKLQGPVQSLFKITTVIIYTAGSNDVMIGIDIEKADDMIHDIREKLQVYLDSDEVKRDEF